MRIKKGFNLITVCGEKIVVAEGDNNIDFGNIISMNESSAYLWEKVFGKDFTVEDIAKLLTEEYEVSETDALEDAKEVVEQWLEAEIAE